MRAWFADAAHETSVLRRLDARTKLGVTVATAVTAVAAGNLASEGLLFAMTFAYAALLKRPTLLALLYVLLAAMMLLAGGCAVLVSSWVPGLGGLSPGSIVIPFLRGAAMMNVVMVLALTTRVEDLLGTLERLRLPFMVFLPAAVMLRFIPTFTNDIRQVWETLRVRGWPMGPQMLTLRPMLASRLLFVPILFRALKSSETLGVAAELKGLGSAGRTVMPTSRTLNTLDARVWALTILTAVGAALAEALLVGGPSGGVGMP